MTETRYLTVDEVADSLRVNAQTIQRLIRAGDLPAIRVGKLYRIAEEEFAAYLARSATKATA